jgi:murein DD-endopeptidase MepM/ murein hydrolase activator NlpD
MVELCRSGVRDKRWVTVVALFAVSGALVASPADGNPADDKRRVDKQLAQAEAALESATVRARRAGVAFAQANQQLPAAQRAVAQARGKVAAAQVQADVTAAAAKEARDRLNAAEVTLRRSEQHVRQARDHLDGFVRASYQSSPYMGAAVVLGAESPGEVIASLDYLNDLAGTERQAVDDVTKSRLVAAQHRADVAERRRAADAADARAKRALADARGEQAVAEKAQQRVTELVNQHKAALRVADQEKAANAKQFAELQAESKRIAAALREAARQARERAKQQGRKPPPPRGGRPDPGRPSSGGILSMPVNGYKSSDFGYRYDPYYRVWQLHAGTDFAAPGGAPIWAADDGVVVRAGRNGGYGNYTCIFHHDLSDGRGLSTCYAHQSRILVSVGQHVVRGQRIGRVGTTGASTGNHLHFEVRLDGEPVNPLRWL